MNVSMMSWMCRSSSGGGAPRRAQGGLPARSALPVDQPRRQSRERVAEEPVERPPEERIDPALDVEEEEEHAGDRVEHRCPCRPAAARSLGREAPPPRTQPDAYSWSPAESDTGASLCNCRRGTFEPRLGAYYDQTVPCSRTPGGETTSGLGDAARVLLASIRIFNGVMGLVAPQLAARRIGTPEGAPLYPWRMFGIRTVFIGAELLSRDPAQRDRAVRLALPIHASDTVSAALGGLRVRRRGARRSCSPRSRAPTRCSP